jgi:hypothetical protein
VTDIPLVRASFLSALLACLAVLAGSVATVASARAQFDAAAHERAAAPCSHCDDCDKTPCPMPMADCVQVHPSAPPMMAATAVALPRLADGVAYWPPGVASLTGLSPPPDPFPPRS